MQVLIKLSQLLENVQEKVQDIYSFRRPAQVVTDNPTVANLWPKPQVFWNMYVILFSLIPMENTLDTSL